MTTLLSLPVGPALGPHPAAAPPGRLWIAEEVTPLFHTPLYRELPAAVRQRYNELAALYFNEQVAFFEQEMLSPALRALLASPLPPRLRAGVKTFLEEEARHTAAFQALNRRRGAAIYLHGDGHFIHCGAVARKCLQAVVRRPRLFPLVIWLALLQEERSLHYSRCCLEAGDALDPEFRALHRAHLADEVGHVRWDEELLDWLWPQTARPGRWLNARLFHWLVREFFHLPKRSGWAVVERLLTEFPFLERPALRQAMHALPQKQAFLATLYSPAIAPRSFARFAAEPALASLGQALAGPFPPYSPA